MKERPFKLRLSIITGDRPVLVLRIIQLEAVQEEMANEFRDLLSEEDTTETPMYVNRGGRLTILQEDQGQLLTLAGEPDGKLRAAGR
ncbi:DUF2303 family protein [Escherichia coli]|nr:DUF2303 family protein [Escherichia coli]